AEQRAREARPDRPGTGADRGRLLRHLRVVREPDRQGPVHGFPACHTVPDMQATRGTSLSSTDPAPTSAAQSSPSSSRYRRLFVLVAVSAYAVDLVTKLLAVAHLTPGEPVDVVDGLLRFELVRNPGAAFSTGTSYTLVLTVIALVAAGVVIRFGRRLGD